MCDRKIPISCPFALNSLVKYCFFTLFCWDTNLGLILYWRAVADDNFNGVKSFLEKGVGINDLALYNACKNGDIKIVQVLVEHGADITTEGCLTIAIELYNQEVILALINAGADINMVCRCKIRGLNKCWNFHDYINPSLCEPEIIIAEISPCMDAI